MIIVPGCRSASLIVASVLCAQLTFAQTGTLMLGEPVELPIAERALSARAADMNGDGLVDLVVAVSGDLTNSALVFLNSGSAQPFDNVAGIPLLESNVLSADIADFDNDGRRDIIARGAMGPAKIYLNNGSANPFENVASIDVVPEASQETNALSSADLNNDGLLDLGFAKWGFDVASRVVINDGSAAPFSSSSALVIGRADANPGFSRTSDIAFADVSDDGLPDAILSFNSPQSPRGVHVYLNNATNDPFSNVEPIAALSDWSIDQIEVVDLNGDDRPDIVASGESADSSDLGRGVVLYHTGSDEQPYDVLTPLPSISAGASCRAIAIADINRNTTPDLVVGCDTPVISPAAAVGAIFLNNGTADAFADVQPIAIPTGDDGSFQSMQVVDLAGDGELSLLWAKRSVAYVPLLFVQRPVAEDESVDAIGGHPVAVDVLINDRSGTSIDRSSIAIVSGPQHGNASVDQASQTIVYVAGSQYVGEDTLTYTVRDTGGTASNEARVTFRVQQSPLLLLDDVSNTVQNLTVRIDVLANDSALAGSIDRSTLSIAEAPKTGTATIVPGSFVIEYRPRAGTSGTDTFTYTVRNELGVMSAPATVTVNVTWIKGNPGQSGGGGGGGFDPLFLLTLLFAGAARLQALKVRRRDCGLVCGPRR